MADEENNTNIAYFAVHRTQDNSGYIGGMLVIDDRGVPQEFRCTVPIRPTNVQKALYGGTLEPFMFSELIGAPLVNSLNAIPYCCVVETPKLLEMRERVELPVIHLEKFGEALSTDNGSSKRNRLDSEIHGFQPITASTHRGYEDDYESVSDGLQQVFNRIDLLEPFQRITVSFKVLLERDSRFR